jgi:hypothetical protein
MRFIIILTFLFLVNSFFSQSNKTFFGQAQFNITDKVVTSSIETEIRKNNSIQLIRIDASNGQVFILTNEQESWTKQDFLSLFGHFAEKLSCLSIGIHGKDKTKEYPFSDCK